MSEANRHAQSKDPWYLSNIRGSKGSFHLGLRLCSFPLRQTWRPIYNQAAAENWPSFARRKGESARPHTISHNLAQSYAYCSGNTVTGSALAITGAFESADALSM
jgi:hypothetical protein